MSFDQTDLHTLIVRARTRYKIPIGKVMRVTLQAAATGEFPLYKSNGSTLTLSPTSRDSLLHHAAIAEQQNRVRWWTKSPWLKLRAVLVSEPQFWQWIKDKFGAAEQTKAGVVTPPTGNAVVGLIKEGKRPARGRPKHGPEPGKLRRYDVGDIELFPELERLMREGRSRTAAARKLADAGMIAGPGTLESKVKRLAKLHKLHQSKSGESGN
jgi:hypothetical protein